MTFCFVVSGQLKPTFASVSRTEGTDSIQLGLTLNIGCAGPSLVKGPKGAMYLS